MRNAAPILLTLHTGLLLAACSDARKEPLPTAIDPAEQPRFAVTGSQLGDPIPGLTSAQLAAFNRGKLVFQRSFSQETGLGPTFNASSCATCHGGTSGAIGGSGAQVETHFTNLRSDGSCDHLVSKGGFVHQAAVTPALFQATGLTEEPFPNEAHQRATRSTPDLFGFGLLDAVHAQTILDYPSNDPGDSNGDGISGRPQPSGMDVGRFGRKANGPTLTQFNAGALLNEMGITNALFMTENSIGGAAIPPGVDFTAEPEISSSDLSDLNSFVRFLAPPPPLPLTSQATAGKDLFASVGCASCHRPTLTTNGTRVSDRVLALITKDINAFTDLLLHDLGPENADICLSEALNSEFRTEPLMGARFMTSFMHDGRAGSLTEAIQRHGGEGSGARSRFFDLTDAERAAVLAYINSL